MGLIRPILPNKPRGVARVDDRRVLNGIFRVLRTGSPWRDMPERYGPPTAVYSRFYRWAKAGGPGAGLREPHREVARQGAADRPFHHPRPPAGGGEKGGADHTLGRCRGGLSGKINAMGDAPGLPVANAPSSGQAADKAAVADLLALHPSSGDVGADRGYGARAVRDIIEAHGARGHIPTRRDRKVQRSVDPALYRGPNLTERFCNKLEHFRKVATRYEKTAQNHLAAVLIASSRLWMRHCEAASQRRAGPK